MNTNKRNLFLSMLLIPLFNSAYSSNNLSNYSLSNNSFNLSNSLILQGNNLISNSTICTKNATILNPCFSGKINNKIDNSNFQIYLKKDFNNISVSGVLDRSLNLDNIKGNYRVRYSNPNNLYSITANLISNGTEFNLSNAHFYTTLPNKYGSIKGELGFNMDNKIESKLIQYQRNNFGSSYFENDNHRQFLIEHRIKTPIIELRTGFGRVFTPQSSYLINLNVNFYLNN